MGVFNYNLQPLHALFISHIHKRIMSCDLHVHSTASGMMDTPGLKYICRESYSEPAAVYSRLKRKRCATTVTFSSVRKPP